MYSHFYDLRKISYKLSKKTLPLTACIPFFDSKIHVLTIAVMENVDGSEKRI